MLMLTAFISLYDTYTPLLCDTHLIFDFYWIVFCYSDNYYVTWITVFCLTWFCTVLCWSSVNLFITYIFSAVFILFEACKSYKKKTITYIK
jgi:hypothetical protein